MANNITESLLEMMDQKWTCAMEGEADLDDYSDIGIESPIRTNLGLVAFEIICCILGIPLNLMVTASILRSRRMNRKPRNIFLLGVVVSNFCSFIRSIVDICNFFWPNDLACKVFMSVAVLPDAFLLLNSFFSLVDRYVAIGHPLWHRSKVTSSLAISVITFGFLIQTVILKFMYITQMVPLRARTKSFERTVNLCSLAVPFVLCFVARVTVYIQTRQILADNNCASLAENELAVKFACDKLGLKRSKAIRVRLGKRMSPKMISRLEV